MAVYHAAKDQINIGANSGLTLMQVKAGANNPLFIREIEVTFNGIDATNAQIRLEILRQTTDGTPTGTVSIAKQDERDPASNATVGHTYTAEPTSGDVLHHVFVHPQGGRGYRYLAPVRIGGGERLGIKATNPDATDAVEASVTVIWSET